MTLSMAQKVKHLFLNIAIMIAPHPNSQYDDF